MNILGLAVIIGVNVLAYFLNKPQQRQPTRKEKFELPRTEEGEHLPIVFGCAEIVPNFLWSGNIQRKIIETESGPRTLYYANAVGSLCHGEVDTVHDIIFEDLHLSAAPPTTNTRPRGEPRPVGPALSVPLPYDLNGGYLDEMVYSLQMFGGIRTVDGQGGIAGRIHVHSGARDQLPCELIYPWWGQQWVPGWPDIAYIVFGGVPLPCPPNSEEFTNLHQPWKWSTDGNPFDGPAAGGGGAAPIANGALQCFGATFPDPDFQDAPPHQIYCPDDDTIYASDAFGVHIVPPSGSDAGVRLAGVVSGGVGCPNCDDTLIRAKAGAIYFANTWQICAGCTQGYNNVAHKLTCLRPGDRLKVHFRWYRTKLYNFRFPNGASMIGPEGWAGFSGGVTLGSEKTVVRPEYLSGWSFGHTFDDGTRGHGINDEPNEMQGEVEWTSGVVPSTHETLYNNICYLSFNYNGNFRTPWSEVRLEIDWIEIIPGAGTPFFAYIPDEFDVEGKFYWGLNPKPFVPRVLLASNPRQVSGAPVLHGANLVDCIYETLVNKTWGLGRDPDSTVSGVNEPNFLAAAQTVAEEGLQISMVSSGFRPAEQILQDLCTAGNAILYRNRITGLYEIALVRPDYDSSLLPIIDVSNSDDFRMEQPRGFKLVHQVHVRYRRWKPSKNAEALVDYEIGSAPYTPGVAYQLPGGMLTDVVITQDGDVIDPEDYTISSNGVLRLSSRADTIDWDGPEPLIINAVINQRRPGFEDAVATASNDAMFQALGNIPPLTLDMPMLMDDVSAQHAAEDALLTNSRPLRMMSWTMLRNDPEIHPGRVAKVNRPELQLDGLPVRILKVTERADPDGGFDVEAVEEKYGFRRGALIFHQTPDRPPLDFPGDNPASLGQAPKPAGLAQIRPSSVRLALFAARPELGFEVARTRVPSFYVGDPGEFGPDGCSAATAPVYFSVASGEVYYDDPVTDDGCPYYYWVRHKAPGYAPSGWLGPVRAILEAGTPADELDQVAPTVALEEFEDAQNEIGHMNLWFKDPQLRIRRVAYQVKNPGEPWGDLQFPPIGNGLFDGTDFLNSDGWRHAHASVPLRLDDQEVQIRWQIEYQWSDGLVVDDEITIFPLYQEPVYDDDGNIVTDEEDQIVTAQRITEPRPIVEEEFTVINRPI